MVKERNEQNNGLKENIKYINKEKGNGGVSR
jgi:hypothetical protein